MLSPQENDDLPPRLLIPPPEVREECIVYSRTRDLPCMLQSCLGGLALDVRPHYRIVVVYFMYLPPDGTGRMIVQHQVEDLMRCGLLQEAEMHFVVTSSDDTEIRWFQGDVLPHYTKFMTVFKVHTSTRNFYEFPGLHVFWELSCRSPEKIFLYFHNKGVTHMQGKSRRWNELVLFFEVVSSWRYVDHLFFTNSSVDTVGVAASTGNAQWYNFFWARGSYVATVVEPQSDMERHWHERWLGLISRQGSLCPLESTFSDEISLASSRKNVSRYDIAPVTYRGNAYSITTCNLDGHIGYQASLNLRRRNAVFMANVSKTRICR